MVADETPVFAIVTDEPPSGVARRMDLAALIYPAKLNSDGWRMVGSWQYLEMDCRRTEDPVADAVRGMAKFAGYHGTVSLRPPEQLVRQDRATEYRYSATFDSPAFADQTFFVVVFLKGAST